MLRGRDAARGAGGDAGEEGGEGRGEGKKHRAYTRRTSANISSGQPPIFSTPFTPVLDIALEKKLPSRYENVSPSFALLPPFIHVERASPAFEC